MNLLSIGGSDPSTGAGIQSDIKVFSTLNAYPLTIVTAITSQNTTSYGKTETVSNEILKNQLDLIMRDFRIDGIKIGMVYNSQIIKTLYKKLKNFKVPIVVDPIIKSTTGGMLIEKSAIEDFRKYIIPLATIITPNKFEAEILAKIKHNGKNYSKIAKELQKIGAKNVVITGIEIKKNQISDFIYEKNKEYTISTGKITSINHGSGCQYSAALIYALANKKNIKYATKFAKQFAMKSIKNAKKIGKGILITDSIETDEINVELTNAINNFTKIRNIYRNIPECQTNFVFSNEKPKSTKTILGISGRIVKAGNKALVAGELTYGGSKHVANSVLTINKKFPHIRSAVNIKFQKSTISKMKKMNLTLAKYDRKQEPNYVKFRESTIKWGTGKAIKNLQKAPDAIYHEGDFGKEPMIIVFGETPEKVLRKVRKII